MNRRLCWKQPNLRPCRTPLDLEGELGPFRQGLTHPDINLTAGNGQAQNIVWQDSLDLCRNLGSRLHGKGGPGGFLGQRRLKRLNGDDHFNVPCRGLPWGRSPAKFSRGVTKMRQIDPDQREDTSNNANSHP